MQQPYLIKCTLSFGLDDFYYKNVTYRQVKVHKFVIKIAISPIFIQNGSHKYINTSCEYHIFSGTQSRVITKVHNLVGQPAYCQNNHS